MPKQLYPSTYPERVLGMKCASDLLEKGLFPRKHLFKELSESYAAFNAVEKHLPHLNRKDPNVAVIVIGDGTRPRTAALFAYLTRWTAYSTDPRMKPGYYGERIVTNTMKHEDAVYHIGDATKILVVAVHSHGPLSLAHRQIDSNLPLKSLSVVSMPCCYDQWYGKFPASVQYEDPLVWSPKNKITIWKGVGYTG